MQARSASMVCDCFKRLSPSPRDVQHQGCRSVDIMQQYKRSRGLSVSQCMHVSLFMAIQSSHAQCIAMICHTLLCKGLQHTLYICSCAFPPTSSHCFRLHQLKQNKGPTSSRTCMLDTIGICDFWKYWYLRLSILCPPELACLCHSRP